MMATHKYIYWRDDMKGTNKDVPDGHCFANVHLLVGYNQATITDFISMADELRKTFPQATNDQITGGKVFKSSSVDGHTIITWSGVIKRTHNKKPLKYDGWHQVDHGRMEYYW
jgi:hypothetical protein